jgi:hypothetical protein
MEQAGSNRGVFGNRLHKILLGFISRRVAENAEKFNESRGSSSLQVRVVLHPDADAELSQGVA